MQLSQWRILPLILMGAILAGCAQPNVELSESFWQNHQQKVVAVKNKKIKPSMYQQGQEGLLDMVVNSAVTDKFRTHLREMDLNWYSSLRGDFVHELNKRHIKAKSGGTIDIADLPRFHGDTKTHDRKDFTVLAKRMPGDKLLVVKLDQLGAVRHYYGFIPLGAPKAVCALEGEMVDMKDNSVLWRHRSNVILAVEGDWDQPPAYPNFDRALKRAVRQASTELLDSFRTNA